MELSTASAAIRFAKQLEDESRQVYERVAERYPDWEGTLAPFIRDNKRNVGSIDRTYIGVVSDALDTQFAFEGIDTDDYEIVTDLPDSLDQIVAVLAANEETILAFYRAAGGLLSRPAGRRAPRVRPGCDQTVAAGRDY